VHKSTQRKTHCRKSSELLEPLGDDELELDDLLEPLGGEEVATRSFSAFRYTEFILCASTIS